MFFLRNFDTTDEINGFVSSGNTVAFLGDKRKKVVYASNNNVVRANDEYVDLRSENSLKYLTFEALEDNSGVCIFKRKDPTIERTINLQYSLDSGETWSSYTMPDANASGATISLSKGQSVMFKGNNPEGYNETYWDNSKLQIKLAHQFKCCGICKLYGNVMSLIYDDNFIDKTEIPNNGSFGMLFAANTGITEAVITFPENYNSKKMGYSIFVNCPNLNTIVFECGDFQDAVYFANLDSKLNVCHLNMRLNNCTSCYFMFNQCSGLTSLDLSKWDTSNVTNMGYMFSECSGLTSIGDLSKWNTSNVTDMQAMFQACSGLTSVGDLSNWNTSGVTNMCAMFNRCHLLKQELDVSNWDVSKVTSLEMTFNTTRLALKGVSKWNVSGVTNMHATFRRCIETDPDELDFSKWDTSKVTNMTQMFANQEMGDDDADCPQEILDWSLTRIKHLPAIPTGCTTSNMFKNDYKLTTINGANTISASVSFEDCPLTHDSALVIINALDSTVSSCSIVFSKSTYATLSEAEIKIGTDKGWSISQI